MNIYGEGFLILKGYGKILKMNIDNDKPLLIEDASLIAMEERIDFNTVDVKISDELKEFLKSRNQRPQISLKSDLREEDSWDYTSTSVYSAYTDFEAKNLYIVGKSGDFFWDWYRLDNNSNLAWEN